MVLEPATAADKPAHPAYDFLDPDDVLRFVRSVQYPFFTTSIFPSEMACFLYECARSGVQCIVECGRMHGYSTAVLAAYGEIQGVRVVSIDFEVDSEIARQCRDRLAAAAVELVTDDCFCALPRLLAAERRPLALLVDGPKDHNAIYLSSTAAACGTIRIVAHHNVYENSLGHFLARFPNGKRPEGSPVMTCDGFAAFRAWERDLTHGTPRDLERSSLLTSVLSPPGPDAAYLRRGTPRQARISRLIRWWWRCGAPKLWFLKFPLTGL